MIAATVKGRSGPFSQFNEVVTNLGVYGDRLDRERNLYFPDWDVNTSSPDIASLPLEGLTAEGLWRRMHRHQDADACLVFSWEDSDTGSKKSSTHAGLDLKRKAYARARELGRPEAARRHILHRYDA